MSVNNCSRSAADWSGSRTIRAARMTFSFRLEADTGGLSSTASAGRNCAFTRRFCATPAVLAASRYSAFVKVGRVEIVFACDAHKGEEGVASGVGERRSHPTRRRRLGNRADRPFRRQPLARRMGERRGETDEPRLLVDRRRLDGCDLMTAEGLPHDIEPTRERRIAKGLIMITRVRRPNGRGQATSPDW